jgi:hypothetical protein
MTNFGDPDFIKEMVKDLGRVFQLLKCSLPKAKVVEGMELICGKKYNLERATAAATTCWAGDSVHPTSHTYAKMALHLLEAIAPQEATGLGGSGRGGGGGGDAARSSKRTHSDCESLPKNNNRHTERSRNWAEQRRDQSLPGTGQRFYRGPDNAYASASGQGGTPVQFGRGGGGGNNRFQASGGRRPYNRGWVPRGKRRN